MTFSVIYYYDEALNKEPIFVSVHISDDSASVNVQKFALKELNKNKNLSIKKLEQFKCNQIVKKLEKSEDEDTKAEDSVTEDPFYYTVLHDKHCQCQNSKPNSLEVFVLKTLPGGWVYGPSTETTLLKTYFWKKIIDD